MNRKQFRASIGQIIGIMAMGVKSLLSSCPDGVRNYLSVNEAEKFEAFFAASMELVEALIEGA